MVHLTECLHGSDNLRTGHLLVERVNKAVGTRAIIERNRKRVKLRIESVCLSAEGQPSGHAEHVDSIFIEGVPVCVFRVMSQNLRFEGPSNRAVLKALTCSVVRLQARLRVHSTHNKIVGETARSRSCGGGGVHPRRVVLTV